MEAQAAQLGRRQGPERVSGRRRVEAVERRCCCADDLSLDAPRLARLDQLAAERAQQRMGYGCDAHWPQPGEMARRAAQQRIPAEAPEELGVVVLDREAEAQALEAFRARAGDVYAAIR
jgi:hypothetical protein